MANDPGVARDPYRPNADWDAVERSVRSVTDEILDVSHQIHGNPELCYEERFAHGLLCDRLESHGFAVARSVGGTDTAFVATKGTGAVAVGIVLEYDALPGLGHGCGHNIIAAAGYGAALGAAQHLAEGCKLVVLGCPAEEGGGGKIGMIDAGAFDGLSAAMMVHPASWDLELMESIAIQELQATYHGRAAHAAATPQEGLNALDAAVLGYMGVAALRQHIRPEERVHGVFTNGGDKPNIVPDRAATQWYVRSATLASLEPLVARVSDSLAAGAAATGCAVEIEHVGKPYAEIRNNRALIDLYAAAAHRTGRTVMASTPGRSVMGSTDMGNVSQVVPSIHPMVSITADGFSIHTPEFASAACSAAGDRAAVDAAVAMALCCVELWANPAERNAVASEFADRVG